MNKQYISIGIAAGLMYLAWSGKIKNSVANTAAVAVGASVLVRNVPVVNQYL